MGKARPNSVPATSIASPLQPVLFKTRSLYLAAWIVAANELSYLRTENLGREGTFVFLDPEGKGVGLQSEFLSGNPTVAIKNLREALALLRSDLHNTARDGGDYGKR